MDDLLSSLFSIPARFDVLYCGDCGRGPRVYVGVLAKISVLVDIFGAFGSSLNTLGRLAVGPVGERH